MDNRKNYRELLKDPKWIRKRNRILSRDNNTCQFCGAQDRYMHVHHKYYEEGKKPWEYEDDALVTLCNKCHNTVTEDSRDLYDTFLRTRNAMRKFGFSDSVFFALLERMETFFEVYEEEELSCKKEIVELLSYCVWFTQNNEDIKMMRKLGVDIPIVVKYPTLFANEQEDGHKNTSKEVCDASKGNNNDEDLKESFFEFVRTYKKLTGKKTRSGETEFNDFSKRHKNWREIVPYLSVAIQRETKDREEHAVQKKFFPEPQMLQTYLGKQKSWEKYVTIGEDLNEAQAEYKPYGRGIWFEDSRGLYMTYSDADDIYDGYTDDDRPDGALIALHNGRGCLEWSKEQKSWHWANK